MSKSIARIICQGTYHNTSDLDPIRKKHKEKLKSMTICLSNPEDGVVKCTDYSIYYRTPTSLILL